MKSLMVCLIGLLVSAQAGLASLPVISGQVRLSDGWPVAGAQVVLFDLADLRRGAVAHATTDETGQFALSLAALGRLALPQGFALGQNYPNPFNPSTIIPYQLAATSQVRLEVFNTLGQQMATLVDGNQEAGSYQAQWDGTDAAGRAAAAGLYLYRLTVDGAQQTGRMVLVDGQAGVPMGGGSVEVLPMVVEPSSSYGLVVAGEGLVPYVDSDFGVEVGMGPVDIEVRAHRAVRMKIVQEDRILGDVDINGRVDIADALLVAMYSNLITILNNGSINNGDISLGDIFFGDISLGDIFFGDISLGDVDCDGQISIVDAWLIAAFSVNPFDPALPPGIGQVGQCAASIALGGGRGNERTFSFPGGGSIEMVRIEPSAVTGYSDITITTGFYLGKYEVTWGQWDAVMGTTSRRDPFLPVWDRNPSAFIDSLNSAAGAVLYRLPTSNEWIYACQAGTTTRWSFGDNSNELTYYAWYDGNTSSVQGVGLKLPNPWGLYDMHGNVAEFIGSRYYGGHSDSGTSDTNCGDNKRGSELNDRYEGFRLVRVR